MRAISAIQIIQDAMLMQFLVTLFRISTYWDICIQSKMYHMCLVFMVLGILIIAVLPGILLKRNFFVDYKICYKGRSVKVPYYIKMQIFALGFLFGEAILLNSCWYETQMMVFSDSIGIVLFLILIMPLFPFWMEVLGYSNKNS